MGGHFGRAQRGVSTWRSGLKARGGEKPEMSEIQSWSGLTPGKEFLGLICHILILFLSLSPRIMEVENILYLKGITTIGGTHF